MITTNCPIPFSDSDCVLLAHGGGGRMTDEKTEQALAVMQNYPEGKNAAVIGCIQEKGYALVKMKTLYGNYRIVDMLSDEQLPRI